MIHSVSANQDTFREVMFERGLNVVVADRTHTSTAKDTRNGLGKSTLIDIIDFCLGGSHDKGKKLNVEPLQDWAFTLEATLGSNRVRITRAVAAGNRIQIDGPTVGWPDQPDLEEDSGEFSYNLVRWRNVLGSLLFGLKPSNHGHQYRPSYRSLVSYFIRTKPGAYLDPFKYLPQQRGIVSRVNITFSLGLSWENVSKAQELEDTELGLGVLASGALAELGTVGELETQRVQLQQQADAAASAVDSFLVHPQYKEIQEEADRITKSVHTLVNDNVSDRRRLARYASSIGDESPPDSSSLERLYEESGLVFNDIVRRTLAEAKTFHETVIVNRRDFLEAEVGRIEAAIAKRDLELQQLTAKRAVSLDILRTHGALQEMTKLQGRNVQTRTELARVQSRIDDVKSVGERKREVKRQKVDALKVMELDHEERRVIWEKVIRLFNDNSQALYKTPGRLVIDVGDGGYAYRVEIERSGSEGIDKMKIFCFDLALLQIRMAAEEQIDFLIHDTLMYDAVDPRQRARALEHAHSVTCDNGGQYICTMNSDMIPRSDFSEEFDFEACVRLTLTDSSPAGSLLGMRFERPAS